MFLRCFVDRASWREEALARALTLQGVTTRNLTARLTLKLRALNSARPEPPLPLSPIDTTDTTIYSVRQDIHGHRQRRGYVLCTFCSYEDRLLERRLWRSSDSPHSRIVPSLLTPSSYYTDVCRVCRSGTGQSASFFLVSPKRVELTRSELTGSSCPSRVLLSSRPEPDHPLFHPCKCSGSIRYVHQDCLIAWLQTSRKRYCETCSANYEFTKGSLPPYTSSSFGLCYPSPLLCVG